MSRRRRKKRTYADPVLQTTQDVLEEMLACDTVCGNLGAKKIDKYSEYSVADIDELLDQLPGVTYVLDRIVNYIFSNGLTTGDEDMDKDVLDPWLYEQKNRRGVTNYEELKTTVRLSKAYGECGLRMYEGNVYHYKRGQYGMIVLTEDGIEEVQAFFIRENGKPIERDINMEDFDKFETYADITDYFKEHELILLDPETEFINVKNDTSELHGESPFARDKQRMELMLSVYERLNYDIEYDGPGRIIIRPKDGRIASDNNDISTGQIIDNSVPAQQKRNEKARQEVKRVAREIKESSSDSVILLSNAFGENIEHLPRVTKATEFFDWISNDTVIISQILGMSPTLLEVGKLHGNVSVEKIIDNAMLNSIIPQREGFAVQFSKMVASALGVTKIYFDKYDMLQVEDENNTRVKVTEMIKNISYANKATPSEDMEKVIDDLSDLLRNSLYNDKGRLITL